MTDEMDLNKPSPKFVNLACDSPSNNFRMADIPILAIGRYQVRAVGSGPFSAWSAWRDDTHKNPWSTRFHVVKVGNGSMSVTEFDKGSRFATGKEAIAQAGTHFVEVKNEELLIFCILDAAGDNRGGLTLEITRMP